jgi:hypothetical protein
MARERVTFYLDAKLIEEADAAAAEVAIDRAVWIRMLVAKELRARRTRKD